MTDKGKQDGLFGGPETGVLTDSEIEAEIARGLLLVNSTFDKGCLEASSYDVRVGDKGVLGGEGIEIDLRKTPIELGPGAYCGVISQEKLKLPVHILARIGSKRALSYDGVILLTGSLIDPGYEGHLLFGLYNASQRKVLVRQGRKICNVVFEKLGKNANKAAPSDPNLRSGNFPDAFIDRMANLDVLPWMQISDRVKQIEQITKDIIDLKARYEDVLQPIRDLTKNVSALTQDVSTLTEQTKGIARDVEATNRISGENTKQITQLTTNLATLAGSVQAMQDRTRSVEDTNKTQAEKVSTLGTELGRLKIIAWIFWGAILLLAGAFGRDIFSQITKPSPPPTPASTQGAPENPVATKKEPSPASTKQK